jgi:hypothetical protein
MKLTTALYPIWVRDHHTQHVLVHEGSVDIYDFLINWQGKHLVGGRSCLFWLSYCVGVLCQHVRNFGKRLTYDFLISWKKMHG